jgi:hypothetical protein
MSILSHERLVASRKFSDFENVPKKLKTKQGQIFTKNPVQQLAWYGFYK